MFIFRETVIIKRVKNNPCPLPKTLYIRINFTLLTEQHVMHFKIKISKKQHSAFNMVRVKYHP